MKKAEKRRRTLHLLAAEIAMGMLVNLLALGVFFKLSRDVFEAETVFFDTKIMHLVYAWRSPLHTQMMLFITNLGGPLLLGAALLVAIFLSLKKHTKRSWFFLAVFITGIVLNLALKNMFHRPRPDIMPLVHEDSYSFPSGHAMHSFIFYMTLAYMYYHYTHNKQKALVVTAACIILILLIGMSRVYLGVHYPSDVVAGYFGGLWWFLTVLLFEKILVLEHLVEKRNN